jgi:pyruvate carboxylase
MIRALQEFRIRGLETNIPFLLEILGNKNFAAGDCWTTFIENETNLSFQSSGRNRAQKLLRFLGEAAVNGSSIEGQTVSPTSLPRGEH